MTLPEAGGVAYTDLFTPEGQRICITARATDVQGALDQLMTCVNDAVSTHKLFPRHAKPQPANGNKPAPKPQAAQPTADEFPFGPTEPGTQDPAWNEQGELNEPIMGRDWGLVDRYPPKASELKPGDRFEVEVHEYKFNHENVKFYVDGSQYPAVTHNMSHEVGIKIFDEIFKGWAPKSDNEKHTLSKALVLTIQCTGPDKVTSQGNPYKNLTAARAASAPAPVEDEEIPF